MQEGGNMAAAPSSDTLKALASKVKGKASSRAAAANEPMSSHGTAAFLDKTAQAAMEVEQKASKRKKRRSSTATAPGVATGAVKKKKKKASVE